MLSNDTVYYDNKVYMELNNYKGAASVLQLTQDMSKKRIREDISGEGKRTFGQEKNFQNRMGTLNER